MTATRNLAFRWEAAALHTMCCGTPRNGDRRALIYNAAVTDRLPPSAWEALLNGHPEAHLLQSAVWGDLKAAFGWTLERIHHGQGGAQALFRRLPLGLSVAYVPKGPVGEWLPSLLPVLEDVSRRHRAFVLKIEPDVRWTPETAQALTQQGFHPSRQSIQPPRTLLVDLTGEEEVVLSRMHPKSRYNIRLAERKGVTVRPWSDLKAFAGMVRETAERDAFGAHVPAYYARAYELFHPAGACELLVAEHEGRPLAALMVFARGRRAWYLYGASTSLERQRMPNYLLQWEAMRWARARGCLSYDLWGIPDEDEKILEEQFASRNDGLWGVYRFKRGFGGELVRWMGAWDKPLIGPIYRLYGLLTARLAGG